MAGGPNCHLPVPWAFAVLMNPRPLAMRIPFLQCPALRQLCGSALPSPEVLSGCGSQARSCNLFLESLLVEISYLCLANQVFVLEGSALNRLHQRHLGGLMLPGLSPSQLSLGQQGTWACAGSSEHAPSGVCPFTLVSLPFTQLKRCFLLHWEMCSLEPKGREHNWEQRLDTLLAWAYWLFACLPFPWVCLGPPLPSASGLVCMLFGPWVQTPRCRCLPCGLDMGSSRVRCAGVLWHHMWELPFPSA